MDIARLPGRVLRERGTQLAALAIVGAITIIDLTVSDQVVLVSLTIAAPLLCALGSTRRATLEVGIVALVAGGVSLAINPPAVGWRVVIPLAVVTTGSAFAWLMASYREGLHREASRLQTLADVAEVAHGGLRVPDMAQSLCDLLVPRLYDLCVIDLIGGDGRVKRLAGALSACDPKVLEDFMARPPSPPDAHGSSAGTVLPAETVHLPVVDDQIRRGLAHDEGDFLLLQQVRIESAVIVP